VPLTRYLLIGGFLGAGKTTAILRIAEELTARGQRVGLITNDQSIGLVDTRLLSSRGFPTAEVTGGCFCCKFNSVMEAADRLTEESCPEVFIAEPVGSCTDLKATVSYPLRRLHGDRYRVAPLSVLVDPLRAQRILGLATGNSFAPKVHYIYLKQLEEAEVIVINKCDLLDPIRLQQLEDALKARFPDRSVVRISAREGWGMEQWLDLILAGDLGNCPTMDLDYDTYAEGEALLGWLNATALLSAPVPADGNAYVRQLGEAIRAALEGESVEIAHLKMTLEPDGIGNDLAVANLVRSGSALELPHSLQEPLQSGTLIINLRAEADPNMLRELVLRLLSTPGGLFTIALKNIEAFRPARPVPTHRIAKA
jgi:Ni2+-binding GTPase involved in maturation of urease and hydrogenase